MGQEGQEALHRLPAGRVHDEQQAMLSLEERLGLDGDAVAGGGSRRDAGQQQLPPAGGGRAVLGAVMVLGDEQRNGNLPGHAGPWSAGAGLNGQGSACSPRRRRSTDKLGQRPGQSRAGRGGIAPGPRSAGRAFTAG